MGIGDHPPLPKKGAEPPKFLAHVYCGETAGWIKMALGMEVGPWSSPQCARWGHSSPPKKGTGPPPQFSAHFYCGQAAGCIKVPLGMEVGLSLCVRWGPSPLNFRPSAHVYYSYCDFVRALHNAQSLLVRSSSSSSFSILCILFLEKV